MELAYRSPFEGDTDLTCTVIADDWCVWAYQGVAVGMVRMQRQWTDGQRRWYTARRDANLLGMCPLCEAQIPPFMVGTGVQFGVMRHDEDCPVADATVLSVFRQ